jgi:hypothetical protein
VPLGVLTYALAGPIVHLAHGNWGRSAISIGGRVALPIIGLVVGVSVCERSYDGSSGGGGFCEGSLIGGTFAGMAAATLLDAALVAYEPVSESPTVTPMVSLGKDQAFVGATGTF